MALENRLLSADLSSINFDPLKPERISFGRRGERSLMPRPFIKWAGGKRRLLEQYAPIFPAPRQYCRYFEPFLGGGAVFFSLHPSQAVLADLNAELINCYQMVKDQPEQLIQRLSKHKVNEQYFYKLRQLEPHALPNLERSSRFIYLNKTCYNGLYRVNKSGQFNVPFGRYKQPLICDPSAIHIASQTLQNADLQVATFDQTVAKA